MLIKVHSQNSSPKVYEIREGFTKIGRSSNNVIVLNDDSISREHAQFLLDKQSDKLFIEDLNSTNGVFVNRTKVNSRFELHSKDIIRIGGCILFVVNSDDEENTSPAFISYTRELLYRSLDQNSILLAEIAFQLNSIVDVKTALRTIAHLIEIQLGAEKCQVILPEQFDKVNELGFPSTFAKHAIKNKSAFILPEVNLDNDEFGDSVYSLNISSVLCVPVLADEKCIALLYMYKSDSNAIPFSQQDLQIAIAISHQASLTIQRMKLMEKIRQEQQARILLERFIAPEAANYILSTSSTSFHLPGLRMQNVSVLFIDIEDSTNLAESIGPDKFSQVLNTFFRNLANIIFEYNGFLKYMGDGLMAVFGMTSNENNHAKRAIQTGLEMLEELKNIVDTHQIKINVGIGINSGDVMAGFIGNYRQGEITVLGDVVNVASYLQNIARPNKIIVGYNTIKLVEDRYWISEIGNIEVKNRHKPVKAFEILDRR